MPFLPSSLAGLGLGLSLIAAIGAQNAFVLRQGIRREHVVPVILLCMASDAVLILAGVAGVGALVDGTSWILPMARIGGAAFLVGYAVLALRRAVAPAALTVAEGGGGTTLGGAVATAFALTWLNPHVYLDTVVLLGSIASSHGDPGRWWFAAGAVSASVVWFTALGLGARALRGFFSKPASWRILDGVVAATMLVIAATLLLGL
ncbi:LysE/ArgO family amino acid transporter [Zafaria sp. Z1313]|uniref:LysE/ArgO family amino acid transporter n=1 Tax=unclassified Zafaria TaxID=2828765 RepID=UPI002E767AAB|nr:LysE/ArgO family amino acid transporter [Zafaria sp. J156]MEE1621481.1 LysE/ArgO family amino acid transporter [Zafaria sp. J156]